MKDNQAKYPQLRFKGFTDPWEQRRLGDLVRYQNGVGHEGNQLDEGKYELVNLNSISIDGGLKSSGKFINTVTRTLKKNDLVMVLSDVGHGDLLGRVAIIPENNRYVLNQRVALLSTNDQTDIKFLFSYINAHQRYFKREGAGSSQLNISRGSVEKFEVLLPTIDEQKQIGRYCSNIDSLITIHQRKLAKLKELKQGYLQKMFPQNGSKIPELRFKGFADPWEQRKLGDWGHFYYGHSAPKWSVVSNGGTPCVRYGELYTKSNSKIDHIYSYTNIPVKNLKLSRGTEVLIPRVGEDPLDFAHCAWLSLPNVAIGEMISVYNTKQNPLFTAYSFNSTLKYEFAKRVEGGGVANLYYAYLTNIPISFPSMKEQAKVTQLVETLVSLIAANQRKVEKLKELKKGYMKKMFC